MAFVTSIESGVCGVAELYIAGSLDDIFLVYGWMTATTFFDIKGLFPVVTSSTRFSLVHFSHADAALAARGGVQPCMAFIARMTFRVFGVAETDDAGTAYREFQIFYRMASGAVLDAESLLAVVAGTA